MNTLTHTTMQRLKRIRLFLVPILSLCSTHLAAQTPAEDSTTIGEATGCTRAESQPTAAEAVSWLAFPDDSLAIPALSIQFDCEALALPPFPRAHFSEYALFRFRRVASASPLQRPTSGLGRSFAPSPLPSWRLSDADSPPSTPASPLLKWLGQGAFWWAAFFDHYQDAILDGGGRKSYIFGADRRHWHFVKNLAHLGYLTTGFATGMELAQKKVTVKRLAWRMAGSVLIYWFIQNIVYDKSLHNDWFDYERKYTDDGIVIFDLRGRDHRIELSKWSRPLLDVVRVAGGLYLVIKN